MDEMTKRMEHTRKRNRYGKYGHKKVRTSVIINGEEVDFGEYNGAGQYNGNDGMRFLGVEHSSIYGAYVSETTEEHNEDDGDEIKVVEKKQLSDPPKNVKNTKPTGKPQRSKYAEKKSNSGCGCGCLVMLFAFAAWCMISLLSEFL